MSGSADVMVSSRSAVMHAEGEIPNKTKANSRKRVSGLDFFAWRNWDGCEEMNGFRDRMPLFCPSLFG